jgi:FkbM family methyltransferase
MKPELITPQGEVISYAQNREDIILDFLLNSAKNGFYVDIGANHPLEDSVTQYFYMRGWHGINIEPNLRLFNELKKLRPRDINLNVAIGDRSGHLGFRQYSAGAHGLSTLSPQLKKENSQRQFSYKDYEVEVRTLREVLEEHAKNNTINFLKIDIEGFEYQAILGNNWQKYRPQIIVVEANHIVKDWRPLLKKADYIEVFFDGLNRYYSDKAYVDKINLAHYPDKVIGSSPLGWRQYKYRRILEAKLAPTQKKLAESERMRKSYQARLNWVYHHPVKSFLSNFYHYYFKRDRREEV